MRWVFLAELGVVVLESATFLVVGYLICRRYQWARWIVVTAGALCLAYRVLTSTFPDRFYIESPYLVLTGLITPAGFLLLAAALRMSMKKPRQRILVGVFSVVLTYYVFCDSVYLAVNGPELARLKGEWEGKTMVQSTPFTCGPAAAATLLHAWGIPEKGVKPKEGVLAYAARTSFRGTEPPQLAAAVRASGRSIPLRVKILSTSLAELRDIDRPAILFVTKGRRRHVVTLLGLSDGRLLIGDPSSGTWRLKVSDFEREYNWNGRAIVAWRDSAFEHRSDEPPEPRLTGAE